MTTPHPRLERDPVTLPDAGRVITDLLVALMALADRLVAVPWTIVGCPTRTSSAAVNPPLTRPPCRENRPMSLTCPSRLRLSYRRIRRLGQRVAPKRYGSP
jgi:hypothetical protein